MSSVSPLFLLIKTFLTSKKLIFHSLKNKTNVFIFLQQKLKGFSRRTTLILWSALILQEASVLLQQLQSCSCSSIGTFLAGKTAQNLCIQLSGHAKGTKSHRYFPSTEIHTHLANKGLKRKQFKFQAVLSFSNLEKVVQSPYFQASQSLNFCCCCLQTLPRSSTPKTAEKILNALWLDTTLLKISQICPKNEVKVLEDKRHRLSLWCWCSRSVRGRRNKFPRYGN